MHNRRIPEQNKENVIATQLNIPTSTVNDTISRYKKTTLLHPRKILGDQNAYWPDRRRFYDAQFERIGLTCRAEQMFVIKAQGGNTKYQVLTFVISMYITIKAVVCDEEFLLMLDKFENCQCRLENT